MTQLLSFLIMCWPAVACALLTVVLHKGFNLSRRLALVIGTLAAPVIVIGYWTHKEGPQASLLILFAPLLLLAGYLAARAGLKIYQMILELKGSDAL